MGPGELSFGPFRSCFVTSGRVADAPSKNEPARWSEPAHEERKICTPLDTRPGYALGEDLGRGGQDKGKVRRANPHWHEE